MAEICISPIDENGNDATSSMLLLRTDAVLSSNHIALLNIMSGAPTIINNIHNAKSHNSMVMRGIAKRLVAITYIGTREKL